MLGAIRPPPNLTYDAWAETNRIVPIGTSPSPGRWRNRPYQWPVLRALSNPLATGVLYVAASQGGGKTELCNNVVGYHIDHDPAPTLVVEPNLEMAKALSKDRLATMIRDTPCLRSKVADSKSRDSGNTVLHKTFPGGHLTVVGANSAAGLAMRPIRVAIFDEIDRYPPSAGSEGDPVKLGETRTVEFWNAKKLYVTSPGTTGASRSEILWKRSDMQEYFVPCPDCEHEQVLKWSQVQWDKDDAGQHRPETAVYVCERCGTTWDDAARFRAANQGGYRATADFRGLHGFRISALAVLGRRLQPMVEQWIEAQGNPELLKVFINTVLAEWWTDEHSAKTADDTGLLARREEMPEQSGRILIPEQCPVITAGVDVQDNRLEVSVYAWATGEESWLLAHDVLHGDPSASSTWAELDAYLVRPWPRAAGGVDYIRAAVLDTAGHHTEAAYAFAAPRFRRITPDGGRAYVFAVKGRAGAGPLWPQRHSENVKGVPLWIIRVDAGKEQVYGRLMLADPGPGYVHFPATCEPEFFKGLTAEKCVSKVNTRGFVERQWKLKSGGMRNEPLDCAVYAYAALIGLRSMGHDLERECALLDSRPVYHEDPAAVKAAHDEPAKVEPRERSTRRRERWIEPRDNWLGGR